MRRERERGRERERERERGARERERGRERLGPSNGVIQTSTETLFPPSAFAIIGYSDAFKIKMDVS